MTVSILSNCRTISPIGLNGGGPGSKGKNILIGLNSVETSLDSSCQVDVVLGDSLIIQTPGGGGFGSPSASNMRILTD